jgi:hypothetical protein
VELTGRGPKAEKTKTNFNRASVDRNVSDFWANKSNYEHHAII